jgi:hypothetical protein
MAKKKRVTYEETYKKGVVAEKQQMLNLINMPDTILYAIKAGKYEDGKEFITITIDNV